METGAESRQERALTAYPSPKCHLPALRMGVFARPWPPASLCIRQPIDTGEAVVRKTLLILGTSLALVAVTAVGASAMRSSQHHQHEVTVPAEDRFAPFALTIRAGDAVQWVNDDEDDHTVVSDDAFNTSSYRGLNQLLGADGGTLRLTFQRPGTFVYYCRFHAHLDAFNQPVAPGPDGGIEDPNGNFGTPMSGVIIVLPSH